MIGIYLHLFLIACATGALIFAINFFILGGGKWHVRQYTLLLGITTFVINTSYALLAFSADTSKAVFPHFTGVLAINIFLLLEVLFVLQSLAVKRSLIIGIISFFAVYLIFDLIIYGTNETFLYIRHDGLFTGYEIQKKTHFAFHYSYIAVIAVTLFSLGVKWYKAQKIKHDKKFALRLIWANLLLIVAAIPEISMLKHPVKYPAISFCLCFTVVFFLWHYAVSVQSAFTPTIRNSASQVFGLIDVPIVIFDLEGVIKLFNPSAQVVLHISQREQQSIRDILQLSDVETLRLLAKAKHGEKSEWLTKTKTEGKRCRLKCFIKFDSTVEPFCVIATAELLEDRE